MNLFKSFFTLSLFLLIFTNAFSNTQKSKYNIGDVVSDFSISNYDGSTYALSNSGAKATVIIFLSTQCPFVQPYTDRLNKLAKDFSSQGVVLWGINSNNTEPVSDVENHAKEKNYNFPVLKDVNNVVADMFGAERTPEVFLIDNSTMKLIYHGRIDDNKIAEEVTSNDLQNALSEFLNGTEITNKENKAFGCTIKR